MRLLVVMLLWAACFPFITLGLDLAPHIAFATMRAILAGLTLIFLGVFFGRPLPKGRRTWVLIAITGLGATSLGFLGMFHAAEYVSPGVATVIANTQPLLAVILAYAFLSERVGLIGAAGLVLGFVGIVAFAWPGLSAGAVKGYGLGIAYIALAATGIAVGNVAIKRLTAEVDGIMAMGFQLLLGSLPLAILSLLTEDLRSMVWSANFLIILLALSTLGTSLVFWLWFSVLKEVSLSRANAFTFLVPLFGITIGMALFDERFGWVEATGAALILIGIVLAQYGMSSNIRATDGTAPRLRPPISNTKENLFGTEDDRR